MNSLTDFNSSILDLSPATLHQLVSVQASKILVDQLPEVLGLVRVTGILSDPGQARGQWHYGVRLADDGAQIQLDLPANLVTARELTAGKSICVTGVLRPRTSKLGAVELRLEVGDARADQTGKVVARMSAPAGRISIEHLKSLQVGNHPFPVTNGRPLTVAVVQSSSAQAQVAQDCQGELEKLGPVVQVIPCRVNILDPEAVAAAIRNAVADVLIVIRGGGGTAEFDVFDDERVVTALAGKSSYRVVGLGHSGNQTLLDIIAEHSARTPAQAGLHVRECVETKIREWRAIRDALAKASETPATADARLGGLNLGLPVSSASHTWVWVVIAFIAGTIAARLL